MNNQNPESLLTGYYLLFVSTSYFASLILNFNWSAVLKNSDQTSNESRDTPIKTYMSPTSLMLIKTSFRMKTL